MPTVCAEFNLRVMNTHMKMYVCHIETIRNKFTSKESLSL